MQAKVVADRLPRESRAGLRYTAVESGENLVEIALLIDGGQVKPAIAKTFELEEAAAALQFLEKEHPAGKVALTVR
jgi:NADPH:quinone reductase-like Zn-dependent oxidoreductase